MKQRPRIHYNDSQKALMWDRWRQCDSLQSIAQLFGRNHSSIQAILAEKGGIRPAPRCRSKLALTLTEREEISRALAMGQSIRVIAASLKRAPSTVSREINRNGGQYRYRANFADQRAWDHARRPKPCKLVENRRLANIVAIKLQSQWSLEQIAGWLKRLFAGYEDYQVSHETIYRSLYIQARRALKKELLAHLRRGRAMRRSRAFRPTFHGRILATWTWTRPGWTSLYRSAPTDRAGRPCPGSPTPRPGCLNAQLTPRGAMAATRLAERAPGASGAQMVGRTPALDGA